MICVLPEIKDALVQINTKFVEITIQIPAWNGLLQEVASEKLIAVMEDVMKMKDPPGTAREEIAITIVITFLLLRDTITSPVTTMTFIGTIPIITGRRSTRNVVPITVTVGEKLTVEEIPFMRKEPVTIKDVPTPLASPTVIWEKEKWNLVALMKLVETESAFKNTNVLRVPAAKTENTRILIKFAKLMWIINTDVPGEQVVETTLESVPE